MSWLMGPNSPFEEFAEGVALTNELCPHCKARKSRCVHTVCDVEDRPMSGVP